MQKLRDPVKTIPHMELFVNIIVKLSLLLAFLQEHPHSTAGDNDFPFSKDWLGRSKNG